MVVFFAGVSGIKGGELLENLRPGFDFLLGVIDVGQRLTVFVVVSDVREVFPASAVNGVCKSGMIGLEFSSVRQDLVGESVEVSDSSWEPRNGICLIINTNK